MVLAVFAWERLSMLADAQGSEGAESMLGDRFAPMELRGCFTVGALVTMADHTKKPIGEIQPGDYVLSWNESMHGADAAHAEVLAVARLWRKDLVDIKLHGGELVSSTPDHPWWSLGKQSVVSANPKATRLLYGLDASPAVMNATEIFQDEQGLPVPGHFRGLRTSSGGQEVVTLQLQRFHWFFVGGVRVHNKGGGRSWGRRGGYRSRGVRHGDGTSLTPGEFIFCVFFGCCICCAKIKEKCVGKTKQSSDNPEQYNKQARSCMEQAHPLDITNCLEMRPQDRTYYDGWICDMCNTEFPPNPPTAPFLHCRMCDVDFCQGCGALERPPPPLPPPSAPPLPSAPPPPPYGSAGGGGLSNLAKGASPGGYVRLP